jgi:hypothetical protein
LPVSVAGYQAERIGRRAIVSVDCRLSDEIDNTPAVVSASVRPLVFSVASVTFVGCSPNSLNAERSNAERLLPGCSQAARNRVNAEQEIHQKPVTGCVVITGQRKPPIPQKRNLLPVQRQQCVCPDLMSHREPRPTSCRISAQYLVQHQSSQVEFFHYAIKNRRNSLFRRT